MKASHSTTGRGGFTLVETVLAVGITAVVLVTMLSLLPFGLGTLKEASSRAADARILQGLVGRYQMQDWVSVEEQESAGSTRDFFFDDKGVSVEEGDTARIYTARVGIAPPPLVPGELVVNPYLRRLEVEISDRPPEAGDPFVEDYPTRKHSALIAKVDK